MTDTPPPNAEKPVIDSVAIPMDDKPADPPPSSPPQQPARKRSAVPYLYLGGLAALGLAAGWLWVRPVPQVETATIVAPGVAQSDLAALASQSTVDALARRVATLEGRPAPVIPTIPAIPDIGPLEMRLNAALDRLAALENRPAVAVTPPAPAADTSAMTSRQEALAMRLQAAEAEQQNRINAAERTLTERLAGLEARLGQAETLSTRLNAVEDRMRILARLAALRAALQAGQPLGPLQGAPAALVRFSTEAPPTLASLKLAYPTAAEAALAASAPPTHPEQGVLESAWNRAQTLITVRRGEEVIVGAPAAGLLESARLSLEAGDLPRAVATLDRLQPASAAAMATWAAQAKALLAAQAALTALEAGGAQ